MAVAVVLFDVGSLDERFDRLSPPASVSLAMLGALAFMGFVVFCVFWQLHRRSLHLFRQQKAAAHQVDVEWDEEAISFRSIIGNSRLPWPLFSRWLDGPQTLLLDQNDILSNPIRKRALDPAAEGEIRLHPTKAGVPARGRLGFPSRFRSPHAAGTDRRTPRSVGVSEQRDETIVVEVEVTLEDQIGFNEHLLRDRAIWLPRLLWVGSAILFGPPVGIGLGSIIGYLANGADRPLIDDIGAFVLSDWREIASTCLLISAACLVIWLVLRVARRPILRRQLRRILAQRPGIDATDPQLREHVIATFDAVGYCAKGQGTVTQIEWWTIRGLEETDALMVLRTGRLAGFVLPKRDIPPAKADAIRRMVSERMAAVRAR